MGCGPDDASISNQQRLRCFVANAELRGNSVRHLTVCLHCDDRVSRVGHSCLGNVRVEVFDELIERLGAHSARKAVFEEKQRPGMTLGQDAVEIGDVVQGRQIWVQTFSRPLPASP